MLAPPEFAFSATDAELVNDSAGRTSLAGVGGLGGGKCCFSPLRNRLSGLIRPKKLRRGVLEGGGTVAGVGFAVFGSGAAICFCSAGSEIEISCAGLNIGSSGNLTISKLLFETES